MTMEPETDPKPPAFGWRLVIVVSAVAAALLALWGAPDWLVAFVVAAGAIVALSTAEPRAAALSRALVETRLEEGTERRLARLLEAVPAPAIILDRRALVIHANRAAHAAFPAMRADYPLSFSLRVPDLLDAVDAVLGGGAAETVEIVERVPVERSFLATVAPLRVRGEQEGGRERVLVFLHETTQERRIEGMRVDFIANASHELRTPLASIIGFIDTLQGPARNDVTARERFLGIMAEQARRMARLIEDLLSLSRIELNQHIRPAARVELVTLVGHVLDMMSGLARERGVRLDLVHTGAEAIIVAGDRDELVRLLENLVENAMKYGGSGGKVDVSLDIGTGTDGGREVQIAVRDYGPGIAPEHLPRLTERFYRADADQSRVQGSTGLGLAIVKHIVNHHRGRLAISSEVGHGATFAVTLAVLELRPRKNTDKAKA